MSTMSSKSKSRSSIRYSDKFAHLREHLDDVKWWGFQDNRCFECGKTNSEISGLLMQCAICKQSYFCSGKCFNDGYAKHAKHCTTGNALGYIPSVSPLSPLTLDTPKGIVPSNDTNQSSTSLVETKCKKQIDSTDVNQKPVKASGGGGGSVEKETTSTLKKSSSCGAIAESNKKEKSQSKKKKKKALAEDDLKTKKKSKKKSNKRSSKKILQDASAIGDEIRMNQDNVVLATESIGTATEVIPVEQKNGVVVSIDNEPNKLMTEVAPSTAVVEAIEKTADVIDTLFDDKDEAETEQITIKDFGLHEPIIPQMVVVDTNIDNDVEVYDDLTQFTNRDEDTAVICEVYDVDPDHHHQYTSNLEQEQSKMIGSLSTNQWKKPTTSQTTTTTMRPGQHRRSSLDLTHMYQQRQTSTGDSSDDDDDEYEYEYEYSTVVTETTSTDVSYKTDVVEYAKRSLLSSSEDYISNSSRSVSKLSSDRLSFANTYHGKGTKNDDGLDDDDDDETSRTSRSSDPDESDSFSYDDHSSVFSTSTDIVEYAKRALFQSKALNRRSRSVSKLTDQHYAVFEKRRQTSYVPPPRKRLSVCQQVPNNNEGKVFQKAMSWRKSCVSGNNDSEIARVQDDLKSVYDDDEEEEEKKMKMKHHTSNISTSNIHMLSPVCVTKQLDIYDGIDNQQETIDSNQTDVKRNIHRHTVHGSSTMNPPLPLLDKQQKSWKSSNRHTMYVVGKKASQQLQEQNHDNGHDNTNKSNPDWSNSNYLLARSRSLRLTKMGETLIQQGDIAINRPDVLLETGKVKREQPTWTSMRNMLKKVDTTDDNNNIDKRRSSLYNNAA